MIKNINSVLKAEPVVLIGTHEEIGRAHGESLREKIKDHLDLIYQKSLQKSNLNKNELLELASQYIPFIDKYAPHLMKEISSIGEGANIRKDEAVLLQVRQEAINSSRYGKDSKECTTFAVSSPYTKKGGTYAGQNADLEGPFQKLTTVMSITAENKPTIMMVLPAGQVSYIGMNSEGISACANFICCEGWRRGFPRYLLTRLALEQKSISESEKALLTPQRASSRNLMITSATGEMICYELAPDQHELLKFPKGMMAHSNHILGSKMQSLEAASDDWLHNSQLRYERMVSLIESQKGEIELDDLMLFLRDHENYPESICDHEQHDSDSHTFASIIMDLDHLKMYATIGLPCKNEYRLYEMR